jgi:DNA-binding response OmpR family regulator
MKLQVLFVEDDEGFVDLIRDYTCMLQHNFDFHYKNTVDDAFEFIQHNYIDIIISDNVINTFHDGEDFCTKVRSLKFSNYVYFILISGSEYTDSAIFGDNVGVDDFILKTDLFHRLFSRLSVAARICTFYKKYNCLKSLLKICSISGKVFDEDTKSWITMEKFLSDKLDLNFSHAISTDTMKIEFDKINALKKELQIKHNLKEEESKYYP